MLFTVCVAQIPTIWQEWTGISRQRFQECAIAPNIGASKHYYFFQLWANWVACQHLKEPGTYKFGYASNMQGNV